MTIPSMGLGTFRLKDQQAYDSVAAGLALGYRHVDTAQIYGNEADVGRAIADSGIPRGEIFVTTKIWTENLGRESLKSSLKESLQKLATDRLDLTLVHWPSPDNAVPLVETMQALLEAKREGLTRLIGVSNFPIAHLEQAIAAVGAGEIATNQVEIHPFLQNRRLADYARGQGIHLTAYMPLAYGRVMENAAIGRLAQARGVTAAQLTLAWLLRQGFAVIPSSTRRANLASNLLAAEIALTADEMAVFASLDEHARIANPDFAPLWD